ncbi:MAG: hypothetical protein ACOYEH_05380 [Caldicoprobacterales bacterium]|nr:hypothetical protein [Clostridiales bacterium]
MIRFSQSVTGLTSSDVIIENGTVSVTAGSLTGSGDTWTIEILPIPSRLYSCIWYTHEIV